MISLSFGVELELLVRPKLEHEGVVELFRSDHWKFGKPLDRKERTNNSLILREILAKQLTEGGIPAHLTRRAYSQWIVDWDGRLFEPPEEGGFKPFCM